MTTEAARAAMLAWIAAWADDPQPFSAASYDEAVFAGAAHQRFALHYAAIAPFRAYCDALGRSPDNVTDWRAIPLLPTAAFKHSRPQVQAALDAPAAVFETSGTTDGAPGTVRLASTAVYDAAALATFRHLVPTPARLRCVSLVPGPDTRPNSSLGHMVERFGNVFGDGPMASMVSEVDERPVAVFATTIALDLALETWPSDHRITLPPSSVLMDTGGPKGRQRTIDRTSQHRRVEDAWGIAATHIVGELGMTELSSQRYETVLRAATVGDLPAARIYVGPPWLRSLVLDPVSMRPAPMGTVGLVGHLDLANVDSCAFVLTGDLGELETVAPGVEGLRLHGRAPGAILRGCGLLSEQA